MGKNTIKNEKIFKREFFLKSNKKFIILLSLLLFCDLGMIIYFQKLPYPNINEETKKHIRAKYVQSILYEIDQTKQSHTLKKNNKSLLKMKPSKKVDKKIMPIKTDSKPKGIVTMVIVNISDSFTDLVDRIVLPEPTAQFKGDLDKMLDKVLMKIEHEISKNKFDPSLDFENKLDEKLVLKRDDFNPTINEKRIENIIFEHNAKRENKEVSKTIKGNEKYLEYCIHKFTRFNKRKEYLFSVKFEIDYQGKVVRNSIKLKETNINDPKLIQCLIRVISSWNNFGKIDDLEITYKVNKKWIF